MCARYYCLLSALCVSVSWGMIPEEGDIPLTGEMIEKEKLHGTIIQLLWQYNNFSMKHHTYQMDDQRTILALQGGFPSAVKIFKHNKGIFKEIQEIKDSFYPVVTPKGTALAVVKNVKKKEDNGRACCLEYYYYTRRINKGVLEEKFELKTKCTFDHIIESMQFNNEGTRLTVKLFLSNDEKGGGSGKYEKKEFITTKDELEPVTVGLAQQLWDAVVGKSDD